MALTVPQAGVIAGAAASVQVPVPETGAVLSELGGRMAEIAGRWKQERLNVQGRRAVLGMTRDLGALRQEVQQIPDPEEASAVWDRRAAEIRGQYFTDGLDPGLAQEMDLAWTELKDRHDLDLGSWMIGQRQSWANAEWVQTSSEIAAAVPGADDTTFQALLDQGLAGIEDRLAQGVITPEQAAQERVALQGQLWSTRADEAIQADPQAFLDAASRGEYAGLGPDLAGRISVAQGELDRRAAAAAKDAEVNAKAAQKIVDGRVQSIGSLYGEGRTVADAAWLDTPEAQASPYWAEAKAAQALAAELPGFQSMTPAELSAAVAAEEARPIDPDRPWEAKRLAVLKGWADEAMAGWNTKPIDTARAAGMTVPELPAFDPTDPRGFAEGLAARVAFGEGLRGSDFTQAAAIFDPAEAEALKAVIDPKADHGAKLALAEAIAAGGGGQWQQVTASLGASDEFAGAVRVLSETGDQALAGSILRGQQHIALGTRAMPPSGQTKMIFSELTGHVFDDNPAFAAQMLTAALARYADQAVGVNPDEKASILPWSDDPKAQKLFEESVAEVMGARRDANNKLTIGGLQEVNGFQVRLPDGMPAEAANGAWQAIGMRLSGMVRNPLPPEFGVTDEWISAESLAAMSNIPAADGDPMAALAAAAVNRGQAPDLGEQPADWWKLAQPVQVKGQPRGTYALMVTDPDTGRNIMLLQQDGRQIYTFRMSDLIREASK